MMKFKQRDEVYFAPAYGPDATSRMPQGFGVVLECRVVSKINLNYYVVVFNEDGIDREVICLDDDLAHGSDNLK
jgi:hypothetical protein